MKNRFHLSSNIQGCILINHSDKTVRCYSKHRHIAPLTIASITFIQNKALHAKLIGYGLIFHNYH